MTSASQGATQRARRWTVLPWAVFAIGIPISILLFIVIGHSVDNVARLRFEREESGRLVRLEIEMPTGAPAANAGRNQNEKRPTRKLAIEAAPARDHRFERVAGY